MNNVVEAIIEIPMGTKNKYEIDKKRNRIKLDRVLYTTMSYPAEYGYIDKTLSHDGDPLDILVLSTEKTFPGCIIDARIVGYLDVIDNGEADQKVIAVVDKDPRYDHIQELSDIPDTTLEIIKDFFTTYKTLQKITVETKDYHGKEDALKLLQENRDLYIKSITKES
ncbi:MAG: inorganic diphosphatase [Firmicutes bacterium]|nr:inorganic diphosphatase [Bacillota bacterium]